MKYLEEVDEHIDEFKKENYFIYINIIDCFIKYWIRF